jgi:hypothetical protein
LPTGNLFIFRALKRSYGNPDGWQLILRRIEVYNQKVSVGGADGIRTHDLLDAIEARSQLRHGPTALQVQRTTQHDYTASARGKAITVEISEFSSGVFLT